MDLKKYFDEVKGTGVLATADSDGKVDIALYARPHVLDNSNIAFIMTGRLMHHNLQSNPHAAFLFVESKGIYQGKRFFLKKVSEEKNPASFETIRQRTLCDEKQETDGKDRFLVILHIEKELSLIGP